MNVMLNLKQTLSHLILGQRGGHNRIQIIELLKERPYNHNQLADMMGLNYRTVKHHIDILLRNELITSSKSGSYGEVYFLTSEMERNIDTFNDIIKKFNTSKKLTDFTSSPKFFQSVMEQMNDAVVIIDKDWCTFFLNKSAQRLYGFKMKDIMGCSIEVFQDPTVLKDLEKKVKKGEKIVDYETKGKHKSGKVIDISVTIDGILDEKDKIIGYSILSRDITEQKQAQERINNLNKLLSTTKDIHLLISKESDIKTLVQKTCDMLYQTEEYMDISIAIFDDKKGKIAPTGHTGKHRRKQWAVTPDGKGKTPKCISSVVKSSSKKIINSTEKHCKGCDYCKHKSDHQTIQIPMLDKSALIGIMTVCFEKDHEIDEKEIPLLDEVARALSYASVRLKVEEELRCLDEK